MWREVVIFLFCFHSEELKIKRELNEPVSSGWTRPFWTGLLFEKDPAHVAHSMLSLGIKKKMSAILLITHSTLYSNLLSIQQSKCEQGTVSLTGQCLPSLPTASLLITGTPMAPDCTLRFHNRMPFLPLTS